MKGIEDKDKKQTICNVLMLSAYKAAIFCSTVYIMSRK